VLSLSCYSRAALSQSTNAAELCNALLGIAYSWVGASIQPICGSQALSHVEGCSLVVESVTSFQWSVESRHSKCT